MQVSMLHLLIGLGFVAGGIIALCMVLFLLYQISRFYDAFEIIGFTIFIPSAVVLGAWIAGEAALGGHSNPPIWLLWVCVAGFGLYLSTGPLGWYYEALGGED